MCGLAGTIALGGGERLPTAALARMVAALAHRGPDERGAYFDERAALGHTRLAVIDPEGGQQPLCNEDETIWIVFNGEIFNHVELREQLRGLGHRFRTRCDTEVVVHAFEAWGHEAFARLNGQFALALWDRQRREVTFARDGLGVHPLYLCERGGCVHFASELKALFAGLPDLPRALDPAGLAETFTFWSVVPPQSVFRGVFELRPGHARTYAAGPPGRVTERRFWRPRFPGRDRGGFDGSLDDAVEAVRAALQRATALRLLRADVPVGAYLSGGLDSTFVTALAQASTPRRLETFSIRFEQDEFDESAFQRDAVDRFGTHHHEVMVRRGDIAAVFPAVVRHAERPMLRTAPAPLFLLSRLVREAGTKVVLTGEGADEMFAGYDLFREGKVRRYWAREPGSKRRPLLLERLYPYLARSPVAQRAIAQRFFGRHLETAHVPGFAHQTRWQNTGALMRLLSEETSAAVRAADVTTRLLDRLPPELPRWEPLAQDQYLEIETLLAGYLLSSQGDRMLMAHSVEGRFPFLDPDVVALANMLPAAFKLRVLDEKHVLKRAARGMVPESVLKRRKQPYRAPDAACFVGPEAPQWVDDLLDERAVRDAGVFDPRAVAQLMRKCRERADDEAFSNADNMAFVAVLSTQLLHRDLVCGDALPSALRPEIHWTTFHSHKGGSLA